MANKLFRYLVEGECEEKLINLFKSGDNQCFQTGKVEVFNVVTEKITRSQALSFKKNENIFFIYDTDVEKTDILEENIEILRRNAEVIIYHIQSIKNFEDEIIASTKLTKITQFNADSKTIDKFKREFINCKNLATKLKEIKFDSTKIWARKNRSKPFNTFYNENSAKLLKIK